MLILRENTERLEAVESGIARLVNGGSRHLEAMLGEVRQDGNWMNAVSKVRALLAEVTAGDELQT